MSIILYYIHCVFIKNPWIRPCYVRGAILHGLCPLLTALHMMSLQDFDNRPVVAGQLLTLICRAKGSDGLRFEWFKDAAPVNVHWTTRNMWETNIPSSDGESRMSVLNIDHAHYLDAGRGLLTITSEWATQCNILSCDVIVYYIINRSL